MNKPLEVTLVTNYPIIFKDYGGDMRKTCMAWGMECGNGWFKLIDDMCYNITHLIGDQDIKVIANQVKEKFGGLRFYHTILKKQNLFDKIDSKIRNFMFKMKWGVSYWKLTDFRKKIYTTIEEQLSDIIDIAEVQSYTTCETCGNPGERRGGGWIKTLCDSCNKKKKK